MKKNILKQARLINSGVWTTTITWRSTEYGTEIETKQCYKIQSKNNYIHVEKYTDEEFTKAYDDFHKKLAEWK